ncbi:peptidyl-prolyl cis-trans isomerase [Massilia sp. P8910]|uniref:peptidylprolyl isomerase n=1 Tax=Massilia antarctica TaxID=2765360 RepID=UPI001E3A3260|nr:peptidyl-prolyl cis-trans isomerase [Massilia antarctica]MCE3602678.1 peptidyl-prolyl cis-trans isomerase [Massilia antarctica]
MNPASALRALAGAVWLACAWPAAASDQGTAAARIDGAPLLAFSVESSWRMARAADPAVQRGATLDALIANRLLAEAARKRFGEAVLSAGQRVGFARDVSIDDQLASTLRTLYGSEMEQDLRQLPGAGLDSLLHPQAVSDAALDTVFGKPGALRLDLDLDSAQLAQADRLVLLRFALPHGGDGSITLGDVVRRQNVQGRVALFARERDFMLRQARVQVAARYVLDWSRRRFGADAVADLRRVLADQGDAQAMLRLHGMGDDQHAGSRLLDQLASQVSPAQVRDWYRRHREDFVRIERVRARHIRLPDEATAQKVAAALAAGTDFATLARRHSVAQDAAAGGALGWVRHQGRPDWLAQLLFAQAEGQVSPPVRSPAGPYAQAPWEIVLVEQRVLGYQEANSESVRYVASRALARETAAAQLTALRAELLRKARIDIVTAGGGPA